MQRYHQHRAVVQSLRRMYQVPAIQAGREAAMAGIFEGHRVGFGLADINVNLQLDFRRFEVIIS